MGNRRNRKRQRRADRLEAQSDGRIIEWRSEPARRRPVAGRSRKPITPPVDITHFRGGCLAGADLEDEEQLTGLPVVPHQSCGRCFEFVEDQEGSRGTCLHPGSGILSPWTDTRGCDFFVARRGARYDDR